MRQTASPTRLQTTASAQSAVKCTGVRSAVRSSRVAYFLGLSVTPDRAVGKGKTVNPSLIRPESIVMLLLECKSWHLPVRRETILFNNTYVETSIDRGVRWNGGAEL